MGERAVKLEIGQGRITRAETDRMLKSPEAVRFYPPGVGQWSGPQQEGWLKVVLSTLNFRVRWRVTDSGQQSIPFAPYRLEASSRSLTCYGVPVTLRGRASDLLCILAAAHRGTIAKGDLLARVWPALLIEENNLQVPVPLLRKVLGEGWIVTVSGRGYRLLVNGATPAEGLGDTIGKPSIAVLPFSNIGGDPQQRHFAEGIIEEILTELSHRSSPAIRAPLTNARRRRSSRWVVGWSSLRPARKHPQGRPLRSSRSRCFRFGDYGSWWILRTKSS